MSDSTAIAMVTESVRNLLAGEIALDASFAVTMLAPDEKSNAIARLNIFLYKVQENPYLKNLDWQAKPGEPGKMMPPPLSLTLSYLMTPYAQSDDNTGDLHAQEILGEAMRVLYAFPVIPGKYLASGLKGAKEELRITHVTFDTEEVSKIWTTFSQPFRLSVMYQISVVQLDPFVDGSKPIPIRVKNVNVQTSSVSAVQPLVTEMNPASAAPGSNITFAGVHLDLFKPTVSVSGRSLAVTELRENRFTAELPKIDAGLYEVRVDVGSSFRRTFVLEVTQ